jgi:hypothetical protein
MKSKKHYGLNNDVNINRNNLIIKDELLTTSESPKEIIKEKPKVTLAYV